MGFKCFEYCVCDFVQQLKLAPQIQCEIFFVTSLFILLLTGLIYLKMYLISLSIYKDISNTIDTHEFNELSYIEILLENNELQLEQTFKDYSKLLARELTILKDDDIYKDYAKDPIDKTEFFGKIGGDEDFPNKLKYMHFFFELSSSMKGFSNKDEIKLFTKIFVYQPGKAFFYYPNSLEMFNKGQDKIIDINWVDGILKPYIKKKIIEQGKAIASLKKVFPNNMEGFKNVFLLPVFEENPDILKELFAKGSMPQLLSFGISIQSASSIDEIIKDTSKESEATFVFITGETPSSNIIYKDIIETTPGIMLLKAEYKFPYQLMSNNYCKEVRLLSIDDDTKEENNVVDKFDEETKDNMYIDQCFDGEGTIKKYKSNSKYKSRTYREEIQNNFNLFKRTKETMDSKVRELIARMEQNVLENSEIAFNQTINLVAPINGEDYKVKKIYSPFAVASQIDYFYPFSTLSMHFLIKNQGFSRFISREVNNTMNLNIINGLIYCIFLMALLYIGLKVILYIFLDQINKPVVKLNDTKFITGQSNQEDPKNPKAEEEKETNIDEFKELIQIINEMVKGDIDLKQVHNQKEEVKFKLDIENFNKEFEQVKIFNIMVKEEEIEGLLEKSNCTSEIIKSEISDIKKDRFVKKSTVFNSMIGKSEKEMERAKDNKVSKKESEKRPSFFDILKKSTEINKAEVSGKMEALEKRIKKGRIFNPESLQNKSSLLYSEYKRIFEPGKASH